MELQFREALEADLPVVIKMLADDQLGSQREDGSTPINDAYLSAFKTIDSDPNNELMVVETIVDSKSIIVGMLQLTFIPYLTYKGSWRCLIEGVRIHKDHRSKGLGTQFFEWAIKRAEDRGCYIVQLTSNKQRSGALRFYESLGFKATHEGFKLMLNE